MSDYRYMVGENGNTRGRISDKEDYKIEIRYYTVREIRGKSEEVEVKRTGNRYFQWGEYGCRWVPISKNKVKETKVYHQA